MARAQLPRIPAPSPDDFHATVVRAGKPVILEGALDRWELRTPRLSAAALLERFGALSGRHPVVVATARSKSGLFSYAENEARGQSFTEETRPFAGALDDIRRRTEPAIYMRSTSLADRLPELAPYFPLDLVANTPLATGSPRLWIGNGGHRVGLHFDRDENLLCMAAGRKRFLLYPPESLPDVYVGGFGFEPGGVVTALVDPAAPDHERYPRFRAVEDAVIVADVAAGDVIYIPAYWWHYVESFDVNVALTFWWSRTSLEQRVAAEASVMHGLLALRALPPTMRAFYRSMFDYFVFEQHGDPYAHVDEPSQGWAGRPTPERLRDLREQLKQYLATSNLLDAHEATIDMDHRHTLATGVSFQLSNDNVEVRGDFKYRLVLPYAVFELVREFRRPTAPNALAKRKFRRAPERRAFVQMCRALVTRGVLVDCESPATYRS